MASFPTSVKSFTTKNTGDVIQAAHVNDLQDEVNAIEAGYRNGSAPLNAAGSTVTSLVVTGGSTLASLTVSGGSTLATLSVAGASTLAVRPVMPPPEAVRVHLADPLDLVNNTTLAVSWTQQAFAINASLHSTGTNPMRLTPQSTGVFCIAACLGPSNNHSAATGMFFVQIEDSSGVLVGTAGGSFISGGSTRNGVSVTALKRFDSTAGDAQWVRAVAMNRDGTTNSVSTQSYFSMHKL